MKRNVGKTARVGARRGSVIGVRKVAAGAAVSAGGARRVARRAVDSGTAGYRTQQAIVRAAERVLVAQGHARFTVERVAAEVGISRGNLAYYFPTRATLLETLIGHTVERYEQQLQDFLGGNGGQGSRGLGEVVKWLMNDAISERTNRLFRELWVMALHDSAAARVVDDFYERSVRRYELVGRQTGSAGVGAADLEAIVYLMLIISEGTTVLFGTRRGAETVYERVRQFAQRALTHVLGEKG